MQAIADASSCGDGDDLIDLESNISVHRSRATGSPPPPSSTSSSSSCCADSAGSSSATSSASMADEHEHLLDVCPPKLEEKLSLATSSSSDDDGASLRASHAPPPSPPPSGGNAAAEATSAEEAGSSSVLVTLGHEQLVPIRKRIDVVSLDTMKRIRVIAENLEPVISKRSKYDDDVVDGGGGGDVEPTIDQIDDAFEFLRQLDDHESPLPTIRRQSPPRKKTPDSQERSAVLFEGPSSSLKRRSFHAPRPRRSFPDGAKLRRTLSAVKRHVSAADKERWISCFESLGPRGKSHPLEESPSDSERSECSEVDWSWLEEIECLRCGTMDTSGRTTGEASTGPVTGEGTATAAAATVEGEGGEGETVGTAGTGAAVTIGIAAAPSRVESETADGVGVGGGSASDRERTRREEGRQSVPVTTLPPAEDSRRRSAAMSVLVSATTDKTPTTSSSPPPPPAVVSIHPRNETVGSSWLRSSMRRLRQLRLPETARPDGGNRAGRNIENLLLPNDGRESSVASAPNSLPDIALIAPEILAAQTNGTSGNVLRPSSAPVRNLAAVAANSASESSNGGGGGGRGRRGSRPPAASRRNHAAASAATNNASFRQDNSVPGSTAVSMPTINAANANTNVTACSASAGSSLSAPRHYNSRRIGNRRSGEEEDEEEEDDEEESSPLGRWPHALSPALACLGCTLGLFNISRFAILSVQFGATFIVQFLVLSLVIGIPLFTLQVCLGQRLGAGSMDMWKISPLFQGVGIALLTAHALIGIYSIVGVSWMFVYFRDSFITKQDKYRWAEPFLLYRDDSKPLQNASVQYKLHETVADYFSGAVLQRHHLNEPDPGSVTLKFQVAFNLAVVWMIVFVSLSKGLRSYGKVVYVFTLIPVFGTLVLCTKLLGLTPPGSIHQLFPATVWNEFFINGRSWVAASTEVFLTWGLLGASAMQIAAHNKHKHLLQRDTSLVIVLTFVVLLLAAFLANTCVQILRHHGYIYTTSSFEKISGYTFMRLASQPAPAGYSNTPERFMSHASFLLGQRVARPGMEPSAESGYQVLRLAMELVPATLAILGTDQVSPFWAVLFYFILILFGVAQQLAVWHCVITGIMAINVKTMKLWETTITFFSCACAYILGLPMATESGIYVAYYLDYTIGGAWWIMVLYLIEIGAVFAVRGRPHTGEAVVAELFPPTGRCLRHWAGPLLSFTWNVILPVTLMILSITIFKSSGFRELYSYRRTGRDYWAVWARQLGAAIQLVPILIIPAVAIVQTCRYLNNGPPDIFDRIQMLYRPSLDASDDPRDGQPRYYGQSGGGPGVSSIHGNGILPSAAAAAGTTTTTTATSGTDVASFEDPPPKYTPPPSYTTATGARIAKMLRQSFRRSVRRITSVLGEGSAALARQRPALQPPPPDYAAVLVEMNHEISLSPATILPGPGVASVCAADFVSDSPAEVGLTGGDRARTNALLRLARSERHRPNTIDRASRIDASMPGRTRLIERTHSTVGRDQSRQRSCSSVSGISSFTAADVANLLRSSIRRGTARTRQTLRRSFGGHSDSHPRLQTEQQQHPDQQQQQQQQQQTPIAMPSIENLIEAAAPIGQDSLVLQRPKDDEGSLLSYQTACEDNEPDKSHDETKNSVSVI